MKQLNALFEHAIPTSAFGIAKRLVPIRGPLPVEGYGSILPAEVGSECLLERSAEEHGRPSILLLPTIDVAVAITTRAGQIMAQLSEAVHHDATCEGLSGSAVSFVISDHRSLGANASRVSREVPFTTAWLT